ncbi:MAG: molybdate ABC transporter substrate-binding protein, partial [Acidobacteriota bacterium]
MRLLIVCAVLAVACSHEATHRIVRVAAASDLEAAFGELGPDFEKRTGIEPVFDFASSGLLAKQIEQGAPYFLFAAANASYADRAVASGHCDPTSERPYARGQLVVWTPQGVTPPGKLGDLADARFQHIAIANPDHAPYGAAAWQALTYAGLWDRVRDRLVVADSVQAAMQYAATRSVDAAIVAQSVALVTEGGH